MNKSPVTEAANRILVEQIRQLIKERDEARREVCEIRMPCVGSQKGYAKGREWDCFKEEKADGK
jgi:hypothetical protein